MDVGVIGAGIAGLAVGAHLARFDMDFTIYEQTEDFHELGAGIQISPNGSRLLCRLGLASTLDEFALRPQAIEMRRWDSGDLIARTELGEACTAMFGSPYLTMRRADLHRALLSLVPETVRLRRRCAGVDDGGRGGGAGDAWFTDGSRVTADLVVGADGINSAVRQAVTPQPARPSQLNVYRGLVPARCWPGEPRVEIWLGPGQHCVAYPVPGAVSFVAGTTREFAGEETGPARVEELLESYRGWHPRLRELLGAATWLTGWALREGPPLRRWSRGRIALIGDAAHAMVPVGAQGASQAIEDAAALARSLRLSGGDVPAALRRYEAARLPRLAAVGAAVTRHAQEHHLPDGARQRRRDASLSGRQRLSAQGWLYGYDAERAVAA